MTRTINLGILAHIDAGKTSLTERLLFAAGVTGAMGSVDHGDTQTDTLALERARGITIKAAVASFPINTITVNLIDTPGHPDFIAEVERVLSVLDGAVLMISAVEGVQAQTRVLLRTLQRLQVPTLMFVNKIDRGGAGYERVLRDIAERLTPAIVPMGTVSDLGARNADFVMFTGAEPADANRLMENLADYDDALMAAYVDNATLNYSQLRQHLATLVRQARVYPVFFGSAITGAGVASLGTGIADLLPAVEGDTNSALSARVFKVERGPAGEKIAYVRVFSGTLRTRDRLSFRPASHDKITALSVFEWGTVTQRTSVSAGQIGKLWGLADVQIGDSVGLSQASSSEQYFAPPTLETAIVPLHPADKPAVHTALAQLAEQDPLINLRQDDMRQELFVSLYGEVQKEVIGATLADDYHVDVAFRGTTPICIERPVGTGAAIEVLGDSENPFCAAAGFRISPGPVNSGVGFRLEIEDLVTIPLFIYKSVVEFQRAMEQIVRETLQQGLYGWSVMDGSVVMTHSGYISPISTASDFRKLVPLVLMSALQQAGTQVCEPFHRFRLEGPLDMLGAVMRVVAQQRAVLLSQDTRDGSFILDGEVPAARIHELQQLVPRATRGEGLLEYAFDHYEKVSDALLPTRARTDLNPLNRKEYLSHVQRRA